ncbi:site-2 protease family protein [Pseudorhodobacter sp.]|uniref:site-2 protease family protein n=1 Tax=Pseudorhodobacter sp. TaxID=1934400 RepID=UPI00264808CB|nr:site-2 protease family protein [Pseudorhodobacter sp.]MDN5787690.1 site-2 protease family protein [Pseudorhodobacter sp.]
MFGNDSSFYTFYTRLGFPVEIRRSIVILIGIYVIFSAHSTRAIIDALILVGLLLLSIFLHELGHAWGCRVQGIAVRRIVIFGGGGFCEHRPSTYKQDELIVPMGPIVNLALWAIASLVANWGYGQATDQTGYLTFEVLYWLGTFAFLNLALCIFNMVPVQPLDGGRLLHILLRKIMPPVAALRLTGGVGLVFSVLWIPAMIFVFMTTGWLLFYFPSIKQHLAMWQGKHAA